MPDTLSKTPLTNFAQDYLARNSEALNTYAAALGVSKTTIAAAFAEEARNVYLDVPAVGADGNVVVDQSGNPLTSPVKNLTDAIADYVASSSSNQRIVQNFQDRLVDILNGTRPNLNPIETIIYKANNPTANDVGPASVARMSEAKSGT